MIYNQLKLVISFGYIVKLHIVGIRCMYWIHIMKRSEFVIAEAVRLYHQGLISYDDFAKILQSSLQLPNKHM